MAENFDKSLDEIIRDNRASTSRGGFRRRHHRGAAWPDDGEYVRDAVGNEAIVDFVPSPVHGYSNSTNTRYHPYARPKKRVNFQLPNKTETKLYISNLHFGVTNRDIRDLCSEFGDLKEYSLHYDERRQPTGTAEVIYFRRSHALNAIDTFNNQPLDGRRMRIEIVGADVTTPVDLPRPVVGSTGNPDWDPRRSHGYRFI